jgi:beta-glucuronidase
MTVDDDADGRIDAPYQSWVDQNGNQRRDANEPEVGDFKRLQDMGCNTIRVYHHATVDPGVQAINGSGGVGLKYNHPPNKALLRDLFKTYGIRVAMGDFLGAYTLGSGADWNAGTDYRDARQRKAMRSSVEAMVRDFKDEPYLLMWILGNENNYRDKTHTNAETYPLEYARFVNEIAKRIHELDPNHPVVLCNGETHLLSVYAREAPAIDIFGTNTYRRPGFGTLWREVASTYGKPVLLTEYGILKPRVINGKVDEAYQEQEFQFAWCDIQRHQAGGTSPGNALGGFAFEWVEQWWYNGEPGAHNLAPDGYHNEWHGLTSQGNGSDSPRQRQLRRAYFMFQKLWKTAELTCPPSN